MVNLFWPVYKSIEHEITELSTKIHFDDNQITVYSIKISELLVRCAVEIEAISKDLYFKNGGEKENDNNLFFDTDCLAFLEQKWLLSKKKVIVSSSSFYFANEENRILTPLKKASRRGSSGADWAKAYQAVKHNRSQNISAGNIKNLLRAAAALFLLNLYYRDEVFDLATINKENFAYNFSDLFDIKVHTWTGHSFGDDSYVKSISGDFEENTYLVKWTNDYKKRYLEWAREYESMMREGIEHQQAYQLAQNKLHFSINGSLNYEAVLNKNQRIYAEEI